VKKCVSRLVSEGIGTFMLVFAGTGAIVVNEVSGGVVTHVGVAITFGLVVMAMIYAFGETSGAHLNPAVTMGFAAAGRMRGVMVPAYIAAQVVGALAASVLLRALFPENARLGATIPTGAAWRSFVFEVVLSWMLMLVILRVTSGSKESGLMAGIAIGGVVGLEALFAGPISGASMNPARSLGPAVVSGMHQSLWVYLAAPVVGALLAVPVNHVIQQSPATKPIEAADCQSGRVRR